MIIYEVNNNRFKKDNKRISKELVEQELKKYQLQKLLKTGKCKVNPKNSNDKGEQKKKVELINNISTIQNIEENKGKHCLTSCEDKKSIFTKGEERKIKESRSLYHIEHNYYSKLGWRYELWCKNKKGYNNFITYLDNEEEETIKKAILQHLKNKG